MALKIFRGVFLCAAGALAAMLAMASAALWRTSGVIPAWFLLSALVLLFVLAGLAMLLARRMTRRFLEPLREMEPCTAGKAACPELAPVAERLRSQERTIRLQMEKLGRERRDFEAITDNMSEGFLLLDRRLNVLTRNQAASHLLDSAGQPEPQNLDRCGRYEEVNRAAAKALAGRRTELMLEAEGRFYTVIASPVTTNGQVTGAVVLVMDVTEREERESLRREFSANVSHELKTPLTSISGFAELLKDGLVDPEREKEFAGDIYKESQRLISLVDDIIQLSRLDENQLPHERVPVDLAELAEDVLESLRPTAARRQISLAREGQGTVTGVWPVLHEMVYNLCDNAIKYNRDGGSVRVTVAQSGREIRLIVADTGIGIPYAHQSRVFERFYRVDKNHSRQIGGTGLGLSIVKHGAQIHDARLELRSEPGAGTEMTVIFQKEAL